MKKVIVLLVVALCLVACGSPDAKEEKEEKTDVVYESKTKTGLTFQRHNDIDSDYMAAILKTVSQAEPNAETEPLNHKEGYGFSDYSDGMALITLPNLMIGGQEYGGQIMMQFSDDSHKEYQVHYLKIGEKTYIDDGTYSKDDYALENE